MTGPAGYEFLATKRLTGMVQELQDIRETPQSLRWLDRTPVQNATDGEMRGRFRGTALISDILFEGNRAVTKNADVFSSETYKIPKIKHGFAIDEETVSLLARINQGGGIPGDQGILSDYTTRKVDGLLLGYRQRQNAMILAMKLNAFSYNRGGVIISGATWGAPASVLTTPAVPWSSTSATPISDLSTQRQSDSELWGRERTRATMTTAQLRNIFKTDEFKAKAQLYSMLAFPAGSFPLVADLGPQKRILETILDGMTVEVDDSTYWEQTEDGRIQNVKFHPWNKVILDSPANDNNIGAAWMGNAIVPETVLSSLAGKLGGDFGPFTAPEYGPVSYAILEGLNPGELTVWVAGKCWPVKEDLVETSVLTVG